MLLFSDNKPYLFTESKYLSMMKLNQKSVLMYLFFVIAGLLSGCGNSSQSDAGIDAPKGSEAFKATIEELKVIDLQIGEGALALKNSKVAVHYSGWLYNDNAEDKKGKLFDTSSDLGDPFVFELGKKMVIKGWEQGIPGMKIGGKRTLLIPSELAYGSRQMGTARTAIPANSALVFDVELIEVK